MRVIKLYDIIDNVTFDKPVQVFINAYKTVRSHADLTAKNPTEGSGHSGWQAFSIIEVGRYGDRWQYLQTE